jgi:hypothetical protein
MLHREENASGPDNPTLLSSPHAAVYIRSFAILVIELPLAMA